ncbi:hypothetical protein SERLA73DRAFT_135600 [Serpula lacrymans var. lacrymans S7.3]|uniref:Mid2 domain-containing protein n=2 Tax=Serpula lacrymans var. lacrymans TaxID=341189 RepID=F8PU65_SERL3|nr:uncharacterized protein SERLADRAFT_387750 [Serpula lacrymans var. lacrymans S7.9]EGO00005.1 hypothetical protein SERLA73DRAFT_135600 [Serpula lacrymans var. lacrymans S7.3]EGO25583.1 hypothetical protein SERLADRAFT_387750 [Serpula lacrymans var. lacrymans S7.9]
MFSLSRSSLFALFSLVLFFLGFAAALPSAVVDLDAYPDAPLARRQAASQVSAASLASPTTVTTTNVVQTSAGPVTETCVLTFTPDGQMVQEVQNCTMSMGTTNSTSASTAVSTSTVPLNNSGDNVSSAAATPTVQAAFTMPGRSLKVLPVGLGIFGGVMGITIIIVALVTYERTKYRRAFRQRKLAESGAQMGYGGMAKV